MKYKDIDIDRPLLPPCRICGDKASGFHYGVNTCEACKGFFRRTLKSKLNYVCIGYGNCPISALSRSCSFCRYQRCVAVGMSKQSIKIGRYTLEKKNRDIHEINGLSKLSGSAWVSSSCNQDEPNYRIVDCPVKGEDDVRECLASLNDSVWNSPFYYNTLQNVNEDKTDISQFTSQNNPVSFSSPPNSMSFIIGGECDKCALLSNDPDITNDDSPYPPCFDRDTRQIIEQLSEANRLYNLFVPILQNLSEVKKLQIQHYNKINLRDQMFGGLRTLSKDEYMSFYQATGIDLEDRLMTVNLLSNLLEDGAMRLITFSKAIPDFKELSFNDQANLIKASRFEYFLLSAFFLMNSELEVGTMPDGRNYSLREIAGVCDYNFMKSMFEFAEKLKKLDLLQEELAILKGICITFSDRIALDDPVEVDRIQWKLLQCFIQMLIHNHPSQRFLYTKVWDRLIELRSLDELNMKFTKTLTMEWPEIAECPLLVEILTFC